MHKLHMGNQPLAKILNAYPKSGMFYIMINRKKAYKVMYTPMMAEVHKNYDLL